MAIQPAHDVTSEYRSGIVVGERELVWTTKSVALNLIIIFFHIHMMMVSYDELYVANHEWKQLEEPFLGEFSNQRKVYERGWVEIIQQGQDMETIVRSLQSSK